MHTLELQIIEKSDIIRNLVQQYITANKKRQPNFNHHNYFDLESRQFDIMFQIIMFNQNTITKIAKELGLSKPSLSIVISKMTQKNLIEKTYDNEDGREVLLSPTETGLEQFNTTKDFIFGTLTEFAKSLNEDEYNIYVSSLINFTKGLESFGVKEIKKDTSIELSSECIFYNSFILKSTFEANHRALAFIFEDQLKITEKEFKILLTILDQNLNTPSDIAKIICTTESTISTQLKSLVKKGYVYKEKNSGDARKTFFYITDEGKILLEKTKEMFIAEFLKMLARINEKDKKNIDKGLDNLIILFELLLKHNK